MAPLARTEQNIPGENRLFRKLPTDADWTQVNIGDALEPTGYGTGGAVGDFDGGAPARALAPQTQQMSGPCAAHPSEPRFGTDGQLELLVSHGESMAQPLSLYRPRLGAAHHWLRVAPRTAHGAPARGAVVRLVAGGRTQLRVIDAGSGYLCQMEPVAHVRC